MEKTIGRKISKNLSRKYSQIFLDHAKQSAIDALKTDSKRAIQKLAKATGHLTGNIITNKITKKLRQNTSKTVSETEIYISPEERQQIIDYIKLM